MKILVPCSALLLGAVAMTAAAQTPAAESAKVGVIAFQTTVTQTNEFQRDFADIQKKFEPRQRALKTLSEEVEALKKQLQTQGDTLSEAARENRTRTLSEKQKLLERTQQDDEGDFDRDVQQTFSSVAGKVVEVLGSYAKERAYTVVIDGGNPEAQVVLYATEGTDLTKTIIDAYNIKSGVPAQPAAKPGAQTPAQHPAVHKPAAQR